MKVNRLFHVLVVMSAAGCDSADGDDKERRGDPDPDAAVGSATTDAPSTSTDAATEGAPCFCNVETCCDRSSEPAEVAEGFVCCWSTTCP